jgi:hypothetical protein
VSRQTRRFRVPCVGGNPLPHRSNEQDHCCHHQKKKHRHDDTEENDELGLSGNADADADRHGTHPHSDHRRQNGLLDPSAKATSPIACDQFLIDPVATRTRHQFSLGSETTLRIFSGFGDGSLARPILKQEVGGALDACAFARQFIEVGAVAFRAANFGKPRVCFRCCMFRPDINLASDPRTRESRTPSTSFNAKYSGATGSASAFRDSRSTLATDRASGTQPEDLDMIERWVNPRLAAGVILTTPQTCTAAHVGLSAC